jgi:hypothetical protein
MPTLIGRPATPIAVTVRSEKLFRVIAETGRIQQVWRLGKGFPNGSFAQLRRLRK